MTPKERSSFKTLLKKKTKDKLEEMQSAYSLAEMVCTPKAKEDNQERLRIINAHLSKK